MPYRIQELEKDEYLELVRSWLLNSRNMMDGIRDVNNLDHFLVHPTCRFYRTKNPNVHFWLSSVTPKHQAEFHVLNSAGAESAKDVGQYFPVLREIFTDFSLQRLTIAVPSCLQKLVENAKLLKFDVEGTLKKGVIYNGKFEDLTIMGLLKENLPEKEKKYRKRNKTRRKRSSGNRNFKKTKSQNRQEKKAA